MKKNNDFIKKGIPEYILGGFDGLITTFAVVAGATGAALPASTVIIFGVINLIADGFSMSVGNFLAARAEIEEDKRYYDHSLSPVIRAIITFISFNVFGVIPLITYIFRHIYPEFQQHTFLISFLGAGIGFVIIGFMKSQIKKGEPVLKEIILTSLLGFLAAAVAYIVGVILRGNI